MPATVEQSELTVAQLLAVVRRSELVEPETLREALGHLDSQECLPEDILGQLINKCLLMPWQAQQIAKGRWRGYRLGKYLLEDELGRGGMAKVFLARHEILHSLVAIKVLSRGRVQKASTVERFLREARAAAQISHPNIVRVFDVDEEDNRHYLVMEYVKGGTLQEMVDADGPLSYQQAAQFTLQAAQGLARAHEAGLIHRDIKPANLLVEDGDHIKVSDFGLARVEPNGEDGSLTMQHEEKVLGTADYIAPEQAISSHHIDSRADQYGLGYTLYFMLTGQPPFPTGRIVERLTKHCTREPEDVRKFRPDAPDGLLAILHKLTRKKPAQRYATTIIVAEALQQWLAQRDGEPAEKSQSPAPRAQVVQSKQPMPSSIAEEDLLTLAPDEDEPKDPAPPEPAAPTPQSSIISLSAESTELEALPDECLIDDEPAAANDNYGLAPLLDEETSVAAASAITAGGGSTSSILSGNSDVHASNALQHSAAGNAQHGWQTSDGALPTDSSGEHAPPEEPKTRFFAEMYAGFKRGEYPVWILIAAGLLLGGLLLFVAFSYTSSFTAPEVPESVRE